MVLIGSDFHPSWQQISSVDTDTGEYKLVHEAGEAEVAAARWPVIFGLGGSALGGFRGLGAKLNVKHHDRELYAYDTAPCTELARLFGIDTKWFSNVEKALCLFPY